MSFLYPMFIYAMLPMLAILSFFIFTGSNENFKMFDKEVLDKLRLESKALSKKARYALFFTALTLMTVALAQPVIKDGEVVVEAKSADILIGIDISDSMKAEDLYPNRIEFAKHKAIDLIKNAPHTRIGVLAFAKHDYIVSPLSFDHSSVAFLLSKVNTGNITEKGTHLDSMLNSAISMLEHASQKNLLIFTDGGDDKDFSKEIAHAKEKGLRIFIIGVGTEQGSPVRSADGGFIKYNGKILISKINPELKTLATETGGVYIEAVLGDEDIKQIMKEIASSTKKATLKEEVIPQYIQLFYYPLALAALFLLLAFSSFPRKLVKNFVFIAFAFFGLEDARAGVLDFQKLHEAKEAYKAHDFNRSTGIYKEFAMQSPEAVYNLANSLYKEGEFAQALKVYESLNGQKDELKTKALANSGNALVKLKKYEEALKAYENSLAIKEDKNTRENYEAVKKFLEEQKKKEQDKKDEKKKDDKENKDNKDSKNNKDKKSDKKENKKDDKKDNKSKDQDKDQKQKSDKKDSEDKKDDKKKSEEKNKKESEEKKKSEQKDKGSDEDKKKKEEQEKKEKEKQKSQKKEDEKSDAQKQASKNASVQMKKMSDLEAKKWLKMIKGSQKGHLYKMEDAAHEEDENEKPW